MFETKSELDELQGLLDVSFDRSPGVRYSGFDARHRLTAKSLAGFKGIRLMAVASANSKGEPRAAPPLGGLPPRRFYLATNSESTMVKRLSVNPAIGFTYFENHLLKYGRWDSWSRSGRGLLASER